MPPHHVDAKSTAYAGSPVDVRGGWGGETRGDTDYIGYASIPGAVLHERGNPELPVVARFSPDAPMAFSRKLYDLGWNQISVDNSETPHGSFKGQESVCCFLDWHGLLKSETDVGAPASMDDYKTCSSGWFPRIGSATVGTVSWEGYLNLLFLKPILQV